MRILYLSYSMLAGDAANVIQVSRMCNAFSANGHTTMLVGWGGEKRASQSPPQADPEQDGGYDVVAPYMPGIPLGRLFAYCGMVARTLHRFKPDLVYGRFAPGMLLAALAGYPVIYEIHQISAKRTIQLIERALLRSRRLLRVVSISEALKEDFLRHHGLGPGDARFLVAHDAADPVPDPGSAGSPIGIEGTQTRQTYTAGYFGSFHRGKGVELIARIAPLVPDMSFLVVGGRPEECEKWEKSVTAGNIQFMPRLPHDSSLRMQLSMDVLLLPMQETSYGAAGNVNIGRWSSPLKLFEYMATGVPIIASDAPVLREVLNDRRSAFLASADDPADWARVLQYVRDHSALAEQVGRRAKRLQSERYTWRQRASLVLSGLVRRERGEMEQHSHRPE